jgi:hypothetical protein
MTEQNRIAQIICSTGGDGESWTASGISIDAYALWQVAPRNLAADGYSVAYFVEAITLTVTDGITGYGTGSARRMAGYRYYDGNHGDGQGGVITLMNQSPVVFYGSQVYPDFTVNSDDIRIEFRLTNTYGYYFHSRTFVRIIAHEPEGQNFKFWY